MRILLRIKLFLRLVGKELPDVGDYAVAMIFVDQTEHVQAEEQFQTLAGGYGLEVSRDICNLRIF